MASSGEDLSGALQKFERATKNPEKYISSQPTHENALTSCTQTLFGLAACHAEANLKSSNPLLELITEGFDEEQIWQELELQNKPGVGSLVKHVAKAIAVRNRLRLQIPNEQDIEGDSDGDEDEEESRDSDDEQDIEEEDEEEEDEDEMMDSEDDEDLSLSRTKKSKKANKDSDESGESDTNFDIDELHSRTKPKKKAPKANHPIENKSERSKSSVVDDRFFRLDDMEKFLEMEDAKEAKRVRRMERGDGSDNDDNEDDDEEDDDEDPVDFFEDASSDDEGFDDEDDDDDEEKQDNKSTRDMMYGDFFAAPGAEMATKSSKKKVHFEGGEEEEEMEEDGNEKDFEEESFEEADFEDADDDLLADLRKASGTKNKDDLLLSGSESEGEDISDILGGGQRKKGEDKSTYEKRQEKLHNKINDLEQSNVATKPWQLIGEVAGLKRPENSLLEENLEFDVRTRPAPVITEETTKDLESLIKQRILDQAWDDVQRKAKPKEEAKEFKKRVTLDQEKSKMSLGEIYEQEYIKQTQQEADEEKEDPLHKEIKDSMDTLFIKLDALSNFHFTPKPIGPEVRIVSNTPAISMEEVAPISVADSSLLAPEEIKEKEKGELKGETERTSEDRNRDLRKKKTKQRAKAKDKERKEKLVDKLNPGLGNKYSKKAALARLEKNSKAPSSTTTIVKDMENSKGNFKSSKAFFSKLQEEVVAEVHGFKSKKKKKKVMTGTQLKL
ncbi:U3 small nucleolar ribonucleoprotein protein MPP10 [Strongylocentrotus purpuratus]|uniref:U3 small nucleolar ribonucleoprotein protein MPP10 n=1 Tax=Strongylocentrotus purpuratus TaxID=7668 RepID=A0A7M7N8Z0_STRPU|nr:U3 small nucleolar ribonucleoprotein protein MPP10 [Strongylocentrotus purpuratus]